MASQGHFGLQRTAAPASEPLTLAEAKAWLRVDSDDVTQDAAITDLVASARERCERVSRRSLLTQTWVLSLDRFPGYDPGAAGPSPAYDSSAIGWGYLRLGLDADPRALRLPRAPLQSVVSIVYIDAAAMNQALVNSIAAGVGSTGSQTVTPATMNSIAVASKLIVDSGSSQETVTVTAVTSTTFTATFANTHTGPTYFWASTYGATGPVTIDNQSEPGRIMPAYGQTWPIARVQMNAVQVTYIAGYTSLPADIKTRLRHHVAYSYERREEIDDDYLDRLFAPFQVDW